MNLYFTKIVYLHRMIVAQVLLYLPYYYVILLFINSYVKFYFFPCITCYLSFKLLCKLLDIFILIRSKKYHIVEFVVIVTSIVFL